MNHAVPLQGLFIASAAKAAVKLTSIATM